MSAGPRLWIDTDVGDNPDDATALLLAAAHPQVELVGVSTVHGDVRLRAELATALLAGAESDVLVYAGPPDPRALEAAEVVLAIGPLTNLALLIDRGLALPPVVAMGGVVHPVWHRGQLREVDSNFAADPAAAELVLREAADVLLVPLDVTAQLRLTSSESDALKRVAPQLVASIERWYDHLRTAGLAPEEVAVCLHDPLALLAATGDETVRVEPQRVAVERDGRLEVDRERGTWVDVVVAVDRDAAVRRIIQLLADAPGAQAR